MWNLITEDGEVLTTNRLDVLVKYANMCNISGGSIHTTAEEIETPNNMIHPFDALACKRSANKFIQSETTSQEKKAEYYTRESTKRLFSLCESEREQLQSMVDNRCQEITDRYFTEIRKYEQRFIDEVQRIKDISLQYPVLGTAPHEQAFLSSCDQSFRRHRDEMRQLKGICDTLGLKTNSLLNRVLGCNVPERKCEPQDAQHLR